MNNHNDPGSPGLHFVRGEEARREPKLERSHTEIEADLRVSIQKNIGIHRTLARL